MLFTLLMMRAMDKKLLFEDRISITPNEGVISFILSGLLIFNSYQIELSPLASVVLMTVSYFTWTYFPMMIVYKNRKFGVFMGWPALSKQQHESINVPENE